MSLLTALRSKYGGEEDAGTTAIRIVLIGKRPRLGSLTAAVLDGCGVECVEEQDDDDGGDRGAAALREALHTVRELDLSGNKLQTLRDVLAIAPAAPQLQVLDLSRNPLATTSAVPYADMTQFAHLTTLALGETRLDWAHINLLLQACPQLCELHVPGCNLTELQLQPRHAPSLQLLNLTHNQLSSWTSINALCAALPSLRKLLLSKNKLGALPAEATWAPSAVTAVSVAENPLMTWQDVDLLAQVFTSLVDLRLKDVPALAHLSDQDRRKLLIARLPNITSLNGSDISADERVNAERFYMRSHLSDPVKPPRFHELAERHGLPEPFPHIDLAAPDTVTLKIVTDTLAFPLHAQFNWTVRELRDDVATRLLLSPSNITLHYLDQSGRETYGLQRLSAPHRRLSSFPMIDDDEIHVVINR